MGASMLYEVLTPLPDARSALACARQLLAQFGTGTSGRPSLEFNDVVTEEQFRYARRYFTRGVFLSSERYLQDPGVRKLWQTLERWGFEDLDEGCWVETELQAELAALWPLPEGVQFMLQKGTTPSTFPGRTADDWTESDIDAAVAATGPLTIGISWVARLRGLPAAKLCGIQLCLNGVWTEQCSEPAPGTHTVYLSIGTRNPDDIADEWLRATGLHIGRAKQGW